MWTINLCWLLVVGLSSLPENQVPDFQAVKSFTDFGMGRDFNGLQGWGRGCIQGMGNLISMNGSKNHLAHL